MGVQRQRQQNINKGEHEMGNNKFSIYDINELFCVANESNKKPKQTAKTKKKKKQKWGEYRKQIA